MLYLTRKARLLSFRRFHKKRAFSSTTTKNSCFKQPVVYPGLLKARTSLGRKSACSELLQGAALNRGLIGFFSLYRPSCHIETYIRPEKYCFVWAGPLANHHSILTSFFLATAERRRQKERYFLRILTAAFWSYSAATDGGRAAKLA